MNLRKVFVVAMDNEAAAVTAHVEGVSEETVFSRRVIRGTLDGEPTAIVVAGIGKSNAAAAAQLALCLFNPEVLLNVGVAGALHAPMKVAEIYRVRAAVQYDFDLAQLNGTEIGVLNERTSPYIPMRTTGRYPAKTLATGDHFNDNTADLPLLKHLGVGLRDMEGAAIAHVCETAGVPCRALKCVTNVLGSGATGQFAENLKRCLALLTDACGAW